MATVSDPVQQMISPAGLNFKLNVSGQFPGEGLAIALIELAKTERATMSQANRDSFDAVMVQQLQDFQRVWRSIWIGLGVLPKT